MAGIIAASRARPEIEADGRRILIALRGRRLLNGCAMPPRRRRSFTIIEIIVVLCIVALLLVIVIPFFIVNHRRTQAESVLKDLKALDSAVQRYALQTERHAGYNPSFADLKKYLDPDTDVYAND